MDRAMTHDEVVQLLGAFALDAVDGDEAEAIREHLVECPRCASEVAEHWEVTGLIANAGVDAPPELWDRIAARIDRARPDPWRPAPLNLAGRPSAPAHAPVAARRRWAWSAVGAIAAAAAVVVVLLAVQVGRLDNRVGQLAAANRQAGLSQAVQAALLDPGAQKVNLAADNGPAPGTAARAAVVVVLPDGSAFMLNTGLPRLAPDRTYQLWGVADGRTVSLGLLGSQPHDVAFRVDPSAPIKVFAVTDEVAGGVVQSTHAPVAESPTTT
ncbi:MAG: anti-sigma factor [Acidimicrobiales bacterium]|nr:anti-sigma factor [Acidimicrobiales bacterium]